MAHGRFLARISRRSAHRPSSALGNSSRRQTGDGEDGVSTREVIRFVVRIAIAFMVIIGVPTVAARVSQRGAMPDVSAWVHMADAKTDVRVYDPVANTTSTLPMNQYILEVLAAEFQPGAPLASLEAGAVATRTYAYHAIQQRPAATSVATSVATKHGADVTSDGRIDLPIVTEADVQNNDGLQAMPFLTGIQSAIKATDGQVVTYQKKPILAFMFEESSGVTRSSEAVFGKRIPYLVATACPDDKSDSLSVAVNRFTSADVAQALSLPNIHLSGLKATRGPDGFVRTITYDGTTRTGADFASQLNLPSDHFQWKIQNANLVVTTRGRGTDIGMSLHEAQALAANGMTWQGIISHFYPGTSIEVMK